MKTLALLLALMTSAMAEPVMPFVFSNETLKFGAGDVVEAEQIIDRAVVEPVVNMRFSAAAAEGYPTSAIAEYVFVCMKANGESRDALERCSCAIDVIASIVPYDHFVSAETFRRMGLLNGEKGEIFRGSAPAKAAATELNRAQIEAEVRCF